MQKRRTTAFVCQHGTRRQNCSICQPRRSQEELMRALGESVDAARPRLQRLAHNMSGIGPDEAEDVVQETYLEAWRHLEKLQPERLSAWLDGICRNICKRHFHAKSSAPHASALRESLDEERLNLSDSLAIDPIEELERQDMQVLLDRALGHLSESTRELIELCYLDELPQREVAERLSMSLGALELKLHRARQKLHQILHGNCVKMRRLSASCLTRRSPWAGRRRGNGAFCAANGTCAGSWSTSREARPCAYAVPSVHHATCKCWNEVVGVSLIILVGAFPLLSLLKPISRERAEEEHPLISRGIAKKSTTSFQHLQSTSGTLPPQGALATVGSSIRGVSTAAVSARNARELCRLVRMVLTISLVLRG